MPAALAVEGKGDASIAFIASMAIIRIVTAIVIIATIANSVIIVIIAMMADGNAICHHRHHRTQLHRRLGVWLGGWGARGRGLGANALTSHVIRAAVFATLRLRPAAVAGAETGSRSQ